MRDSGNFNIYTSPNVTVITKAKVASRTVKTYFDKDNQNCSFKISDGKFYEIEGPYGMNYIKEIQKADNKKEILLLYRNPQKRFISGVVQDVVRSLSVDSFCNYFWMVSYQREYNFDLKKFQQYILDENYNALLSDDEFSDVVIRFITDWFEMQQKQVVRNPSNHIEPYLHHYDEIVNKKLLDLSKISFVNIDKEKNNLDSIFKKYGVKLDETLTEEDKLVMNQSHRSWFTTLIKIIDKDIFFKDTMTHYTETDFYFYNKLENSELNILNK